MCCPSGQKRDTNFSHIICTQIWNKCEWNKVKRYGSFLRFSNQRLKAFVESSQRVWVFHWSYSYMLLPGHFSVFFSLEVVIDHGLNSWLQKVLNQYSHTPHARFTRTARIIPITDAKLFANDNFMAFSWKVKRKTNSSSKFCCVFPAFKTNGPIQIAIFQMRCS